MCLLALSLRVVDGVCNAGDSILAGGGVYTGVVAPEIDGVTGQNRDIGVRVPLTGVVALETDGVTTWSRDVKHFVVKAVHIH